MVNYISSYVTCVTYGWDSTTMMTPITPITAKVVNAMSMFDIQGLQKIGLEEGLQRTMSYLSEHS